MGYEYLTQPQIFLAPITATNGIYGINEAWPLLTTYQSWTSTAAINASAFPIPGYWNMLNESGSFLVTIGGVLQQPTEYTVNRDFRTLTFNSLVSAGVEVAVTQLATAAPSSQSFNFLESVSAVFNNLTGAFGNFQTLIVTNLTALSTVVNVLDIQVSEVSGFRSTGDVDIQGSANITGNMALSGVLNVGLSAIAPTIIATNASIANLAATNGNITNLIATGPTISNATLLGTTSAVLVNTNVLSAREIDLIHEPANDGIDPIIDIGETTTEGFSGFRVRYDEVNNRLLVQTLVAGLTSNSVIIDRATGRVGVSAIPNQALTVAGNISATGAIRAVNTWPNSSYFILTAFGTAGAGVDVFPAVSGGRITLQPNLVYNTSITPLLCSSTAAVVVWTLSGNQPFSIIDGFGNTANIATIVDYAFNYRTPSTATSYSLIPGTFNLGNISLTYNLRLSSASTTSVTLTAAIASGTLVARPGARWTADVIGSVV